MRLAFWRAGKDSAEKSLARRTVARPAPATDGATADAMAGDLDLRAIVQEHIVFRAYLHGDRNQRFRGAVIRVNARSGRSCRSRGPNHRARKRGNIAVCKDDLSKEDLKLATV